MKIASYWLAGLVFFAMAGSELAPSPAAAAGANDHFANRKRLAQQQQAQLRRPWGGPTTGTNWWTPNVERRHRVIIPGGTFFAPGYISPYYPYYPYYQSPLYAPQVYWPRHHIHIERRLR